MKRLIILAFACGLWAEAPAQRFLNDGILLRYVENFNRHDDELYVQAVPNEQAYSFLRRNIPLFECPDKNVERTYYFRWWTYRKHIKETPYGHIITEFLPEVSWAADCNAIPCPGLFHFLEGRWMRDTRCLEEYADFWLRHSGYHKNEKWRHFKAVLGHAFPLSDALLQYHKVHPSEEMLKQSAGELADNFETLKRLRSTDTGLYWSNAGGWEGDGMEVAVGGNGIRPTVNSYMYSQARALSVIFGLAGDSARAERYRAEADTVAARIVRLLWDPQAGFFKVMKRDSRRLVDVRELFGYVPWCYSIPPKNSRYEVAWEQLSDPEGFYAPYGLTTCEQRHPGFRIAYKGHDCQWNGPSWPYATSQTLMAMANVLQEYPQEVISKRDYLAQFLIYTNSQKLQREDGSIRPWIDENLNPYTGDWIARTMLSRKKGFIERGKDYNHSTYVDLLITGLLGLKPRLDEVIEINPCLPEEAWDYFCMEGIPYKNGSLTIIWDKDGSRYGAGCGLTVIYNDKVIHNGGHLEHLTLVPGR